MRGIKFVTSSSGPAQCGEVNSCTSLLLDKLMIELKKLGLDVSKDSVRDHFGCSGACSGLEPCVPWHDDVEKLG